METQVLIDRVRPVLAAGPPLRLAILFGSAARGALRPDSDVDVGILPQEPDLSLRQELELQAALERTASPRRWRGTRGRRDAAGPDRRRRAIG